MQSLMGGDADKIALLRRIEELEKGQDVIAERVKGETIDVPKTESFVYSSHTQVPYVRIQAPSGYIIQSAVCSSSNLYCYLTGNVNIADDRKSASINAYAFNIANGVQTVGIVCDVVYVREK